MPPGPSARLGLPRERRVRQGRDFLRLKNEGQRLVHGCLIVNWIVLPPGAPSRLGVITSRQIGGAVERSRARRLLREAFRLHQLELIHPVELILIARRSIVGRKAGDVAKDFLVALGRAGLVARQGPGVEALKR